VVFFNRKKWCQADVHVESALLTVTGRLSSWGYFYKQQRVPQYHRHVLWQTPGRSHTLQGVHVYRCVEMVKVTGILVSKTKHQRWIPLTQLCTQNSMQGHMTTMRLPTIGQFRAIISRKSLLFTLAVMEWNQWREAVPCAEGHHISKSAATMVGLPFCWPLQLCTTWGAPIHKVHSSLFREVGTLYLEPFDQCLTNHYIQTCIDVQALSMK
jgi:hypothetical protein